MKRILAFMLCICMIVGSALAEVLTIDLETAADEELVQAVEMIRQEQRARLKTVIVLSDEEITLEKGKTAAIDAEVVDLAEGVKAGKLEWDTSDKSVATVAKGKVKAVNAGTAVIRCFTTLSDDTELYSECTVTVVIPVNKITLNEKKMELGEKQSIQLKATVKPENATNPGVIFTSSDESVAVVDAEGNVSSVGFGNAVITAAAADGSGKSAECKVTVKVKDDIGLTRENAAGISYKLLGMRKGRGDVMFRPEKGNELIYLKFEITNNGTEAVQFGQLMHFNIYRDDDTSTTSFSLPYGKNALTNCTLKPGEKVTGEIGGYQVPIGGWKQIKVVTAIPREAKYSLSFVVYNDK